MQREQTRSPWLRQFEGDKAAKVEVRVPESLLTVFATAARTHGRSVADEVRVLLELHVTRSVLDTLDDPQVQARLGDGAARFEAELRADLKMLLRIAYEIPGLDGMLGHYDREAAA